MTEEQWRSCVSPEAMLHHLTSNASPRKLRLYAVGCCRRIWSQLRDDRSRHAVEVAQRYADGRATPAELTSAERMVASLARLHGEVGSPKAHAMHAVGGAAWATTRPSAWLAAWDAAFDARMVARDCIPGTSWERERLYQAELLQDLFGTPGRAVAIDPSWLAFGDGVVQKLARLIYDEDRFGDLPILADALEDAGCACPEVLEHCRGRAPHFRGCWVVDAVLGYG